jgi:hypothetical protein
VQTQDFRQQSGVQVQYDWSTWANSPTLHPQYGLYTPTDRLQAGRNIDRLPPLDSGWAEIEIDWPNGEPPRQPANGAYFGPMVGFAKEINREENLEVIPIGRGGGRVGLLLEAWDDEPFELAEWALPEASISTGSSPTHIPEPGDIIRVRWERISSSRLSIRASYYDASATTWQTDVLAGVFDQQDGWFVLCIRINGTEFSSAS